MLRRRILLAAGGASLLSPSIARAALRAPPMPCGGAEGDVLGLVLEGRGASAGSIAVFGQVFRPGDVPAGITARLASGAPLAVQLDVKARHPDGSVRLAVIALACPALAAGVRAGVVLAQAPAAPPWRMEVTAALAGRQAVVGVRPLAGGRGWELDLLRSFAEAVATPLWQAGPLAVAARVVAPVPPAVTGGVTSLRVVADVALRADGTLWVDCWFRNDVAMRPGGGEAAYGARLVLDGREAIRADIPRQHQYTAWGREVTVARGGAVPAPAHLRHDAEYLADAGAIARYDLSTGVDEALLGRMAQAMATPGWQGPFGERGITRNMGQTGARADIGPATLPQAVWLITGDPRASAFAIGQAEAAGAIPWHFWDPGGGASGAGGWLDTDHWPRIWSDGRGGPAPGGLLQPIAADTGWAADCAHQPDLGFVPYLLTGRRAFLDEMQAQAAWCVVSQWPAAAARGSGRDRGIGEGVNVVRGNQVRGAAWSLRQLDNAAWASPEDDPNLPWLRHAVAGNWGWIRAQLRGWTLRQGDAHGWIPGEYGAPGVLPPWQQDYFASTAANAARRGDEDARMVLGWMTNFLVGRFNAGPRGFAPHDGAAYLIAIQAPNGEPLRSWTEIGAATRARGLSNGDGWSKTEGDYGQLALQSLAAVADVLDSAEARAAYAALLAKAPPFTRPQDFMRDPIIHIVPRGDARSCAR